MLKHRSIYKWLWVVGVLLSVSACSIDQAETNKNASGPFFYDPYAHVPPSGGDDMFGSMSSKDSSHRPYPGPDYPRF
jgi:hypothetical protein